MYIVYYRVSTKKQGESGLGLDAQRAIVEHYIPKEKIKKAYTEVASAKYMDSASRPLLHQAIQECLQQNCTLVVAKIDRLSRTTEHALSIYADLEGKLMSCDMPHLDKFTLTIYMAIADRERELIAIRTKDALAQKRKRDGEWRVSNLDEEARKKAVEVIQAKASNNENNRRAAELCRLYREKGLTLQEIAEKLNANGFRTSRGYQFHKTSVKRLLERG